MINKQWIVWCKMYLKKYTLKYFDLKNWKSTIHNISTSQLCTHISEPCQYFRRRTICGIKIINKNCIRYGYFKYNFINEISLNIWRSFRVKVLQCGVGCEAKTQRDVQAVSSLQDQAQMALCKDVQSRYHDQPTRFGKLLLMLPAVRSALHRGRSLLQEDYRLHTACTAPHRHVQVERSVSLTICIWHSLSNAVLVYRYYVLVCLPKIWTLTVSNYGWRSDISSDHLSSRVPVYTFTSNK